MDEEKHNDGGTISVVGLIPAAGASRRMGQDKRRLPLGESTVLETTVASLKNGGISRLVVVLEPNSPCRELPGLAGAILAENPRPDRGMLSSIVAGLDALPPGTDAVALLPGDHPFVPPKAVRRLLAEFARARPLLLVPRYPDRRGHPLLIHRDLFEEARACDPNIGLRQLVRRRQTDLKVLPLNHEGADDDLDTPEDFARVKTR